MERNSLNYASATPHAAMSEFKIILEHSVIDIHKHFIAHRISQVWNELPPKIVNFVSLQALKTSL